MLNDCLQNFNMGKLEILIEEQKICIIYEISKLCKAVKKSII